MASRSEREKSKIQEKYQVILSQMLREEDNKYCVDCDTKSPRWASWNIGVFICIRCAGFHRNLGVHISKVKSVNLDSWTGEQMASMQAMGNSRARAVYEANLPDGFRRPQADSTLESFIRAKYEQRKWIAKEWIPPEITVPIDLMESETHQKQRIEPISDTERKNVPKLKLFAPPVVQQIVQPSSPPVTPTTPENNTQNLLNLDEPSSHPTPAILDPLHELFQPTSVNKTETNIEIPSINQELASAFSSSNDISSNTSGMMSNEKIMALFNTSQTSTMNIRPVSNLSSPGFAYPSTQHSHSLAHQKSLSFGNNLYQQAINFGSQSQIRFPSGIHHPNINGMSAPTLQSPSSTFTPAQLNTQFSQLMPFENIKSNPSASTVISNIPIQPVTEYMPMSSDFLWQ